MNKRIEGIIIIIAAVLGGIGSFVYMGLDTPLLLVLFFIMILGVGISVFVYGNKSVDGSKESGTDDEIVNSSTLHDEVNQELQRKGKSSIEAINTIGGVSTNNLARRDKSWSSVPDFFLKMIKGNGNSKDD